MGASLGPFCFLMRFILSICSFIKDKYTIPSYFNFDALMVMVAIGQEVTMWQVRPITIANEEMYEVYRKVGDGTEEKVATLTRADAERIANYRNRKEENYGTDET